MEGVRLDKWLWAARFFKTRALAIAAIESGKVHVDGARAKPAKEMHLEAILNIRRGDETLEVVVKGISTQRRGAPEAALLYEETLASQQKRSEMALSKPMGIRERGEGRPTKRQRRQIHQFLGN
ncbi:MAG: RNA-binding protein [Methylophilales bacterium]|nr:RNA-binding protein [Methylophilales bacterium]